MRLTHQIAVGIVLYKPDVQRLQKNFDSLKNQFNMLILYNNGTDIQALNLNKIVKTMQVIVIGTGENVGIATALNGIMLEAKARGIDWVVTLDQDSIVPDNLCKEFMEFISNNGSSTAILCPQLIDRRRKYMSIKIAPKIEEIDMCSTSGSCTNVAIWEKIGRFDEWLFIDLVDNDFCKRATLCGFKIFQLNSVVMDHEFGNIEFRSPFWEKFFLSLGKRLKNVNVEKLSFKRKVNPLRIYYENRNIIYLNKKYQKYGGIGYSNHHCKTYLGFMITFSLYSLSVGKEKNKIFNAICTGVRDGRNKQVQPWTVENAIRK